MTSKKIFSLFAIILIIGILAAYSNHFDNGFHFDDSHTVEDNAMIRDLGNIPKFFADAKTFSVHPPNQGYRPVVTATLAIDYWLGGGLKPFYFQLSTFLWFLLQLVLTYVLYRGILKVVSPNTENCWIALFGVAWYGLHPVCAETVNYVIQRGDVISTVGVIAGLVMYAGAPKLRKFGLYLIPVLFGALAKPPAIMFAPLLGAYVLLFEEGTGIAFWQKSFNWRGLFRAIVASIPALIVCAGFYVLQDKMTPPTATPGGASLKLYLITQPYVQFHYFTSLFLPLGLSADTDWGVFRSIADLRAVQGFVFVALMLIAAIYTSCKEILRPISFGIIWFFLALIPTTVVPLAEVMNDHRMYFPFVGLILSVCWSGALILRRMYMCKSSALQPLSKVIVALLVATLPSYGYATYQRNIVWHDEESLWLDVTVKSPKNGRGLMNYGLTQMQKGDYVRALEYFERALIYTPNYTSLETNLGIAKGAVGKVAEADRHFKRAIELAPNFASPYFFYARWLEGQGRSAESIENLKAAIAKVPFDFDSRYLLMKIYLAQKEWGKLRVLIGETFEIAPNDPTTLDYKIQLEAAESKEISDAETTATNQPTAENLLQLSFVYYRTARYEQCILTSQKALILKPDYAEAYNNMGSAYAALGRWDEAIEAEVQALRINPGFQLAKNNLVWAKSQQTKTAGQ